MKLTEQKHNVSSELEFYEVALFEKLMYEESYNNGEVFFPYLKPR